MTSIVLLGDNVLGSVAVAAADAADLRWPGYLGSAYRPGCSILLVATVHREFASGIPPLPKDLRDRFVEATRAWRQGRLPDEDWLEVVRETYMAGLGRHWAVGRLIRGLSSRIGIGVEDVAYVNAARCQLVELPPVPNRAEIISNAVALCGRAYPISSLAQRLSPAALLMSKGTFDCARGALPPGLPTFVVDQRQLLLRASFVSGSKRLSPGTLIDEWAPVLAEILNDAQR